MKQHHLSFPASDVLDDVLVRLPSLPIPVFQEDFLAHMTAAAAEAKVLEAYAPSYYETKFAPKFEHSCGHRLETACTLQGMLHELEQAAACCLFVKDSVGTQLCRLLMRALSHCRRFDEIRTQDVHKKAKRNLQRWRGGKARHAKNDCGRHRAARLILAFAPAVGYASPAQAARLIEPHLVRFISIRRLGIVRGDNLRRTIVRWIHNHPAVRAAYLATCTAAV